MSAQERQLLQQVKALRKENDAYKVEFRELRQEVKNYKELLANSQMRNRQLQNNLAHFHQLETAHNRLQTEHRQLLKDFSALSKKHKLSSSKNFLDLTRNERKTIRNRLKRYFLQSLKNIDNWARALVRIQFDMSSTKHSWEAVFNNNEPDSHLPSEPIFRKNRWTVPQVNQIIYVTDKFLISNAAYDELRMVSEGGLPSTHLFKDFKNEMSTHIDIKCSATPGMDAASRSIKDVLMNSSLPATDKGKYFLKFAVDGAVVAKNRFAVSGCVKIYDTNSRGKPKEFSGHTDLLDELPVFHYFGAENSEVLQDEANDTLAELMDLQRHGINISDKHHDVEVFITSDWKCLCAIQGLQGPSAHYFCAFCTITAPEKHLFSQTDLGKWSVSRNCAERATCLGQKCHKGYVNEPLLDLDLQHCPVDFLHLCNGVIKKQLNQVVCWVLDQGHDHLLLDEMKRIGVPFKFYTETSSDKKSSIFKWTTPSVRDLKVIYEQLDLSAVLDSSVDINLKAPQNFTAEELRFYCKKHKLQSTGRKDVLVSRLKEHLGINAKLRSLQKIGSTLREVTKEQVGDTETINVTGLQKLWSDGNKLLNDIRDGVEDTDQLQQDLLTWGVQFMNLTFPEDITPYIHTFVFHAWEFVHLYGGLGAYSMEEVERLNKINKSCFFQKTHQGRDPKASAVMIMRYWNRSLYCKSREMARDEKKKLYFHSRKNKTYNLRQCTDEDSD